MSKKILVRNYGKLWIILFSMIALAIPLSSFAQDEFDLDSIDYQRSLRSASEIPAIISDYVQIGLGYDTNKKNFTNTIPLTGTIREVDGETDMTLFVSQEVSSRKIMDLLSGSIDVATKFPVIKIKGGISYSHEVKSSGVQKNFVISAIYRPKKRTYDTNTLKLSPAGEKVAALSDERKIDTVGNEFVNAVEFGSSVFIALTVRFAKKEDKKNIAGYLGVDWLSGKVKVDGKLSMLDQKEKESIKITLRGKQTGGDPLRLLSIIPDNLMQCSLADPKPCSVAMENAIKYVNSEFEGQVKNPDGSINLDKCNPIRYFTETYKSTVAATDLLPQKHPALDNYVKFAIKRASDRYSNEIDNFGTAETLLSKYQEFLDQARINALRDLKDKADSNAWVWAEIADHCLRYPYGSPDLSIKSCRAKLDADTHIDTGLLQTYDTNLLITPAPAIDIRKLKCGRALEAAYDAGAISTEAQMNEYMRTQFAPIFFDNAQPHNDVKVFAHCSEALPTYGNFDF